MILWLHHKGLERLFTIGEVKGVSSQYLPRLRRILALLNVSKDQAGMDLPGFRLHPLKGERKGQWAVMVSGNWRVVFEFDGANATNVDLVDYH